MRPGWHRWWRAGALLIDSSAALIAAGSAAILRFGPLGALEVTQPDSYGPWLLAPPIWVATMAAFGLYSPTRVANAVEESRRVVGAGFAAPVVFVVFTFLIKSNPSRLWVGLSTAFAIITVGAGRRTLRWLAARLHRRGQWQTRALVVGRRDAKRLLDQLTDDSGSQYAPVATCEFEWIDLPSYDLADVEFALKESRAGAVLIVSEDLERDEVGRAVSVGDAHPVSVVLIPRLDYMLAHNLQVVAIGRQPGLALETPMLRAYQRFLKRCLDVGLTSIGLILLSPVLAGISVAIKITSAGPIFYKQRRVGLYGRPIQILKFRTMVVAAEGQISELAHRNEADGILFKVREDPRVTRLGRFLRRWSLDELPQLLNVLFGTMSLVGPRPALPNEVESYEAAVARRLNTRPGITGLWQIGGRSLLPFDEYVRLDLTYVQNWSPILDLYVLARTIPAVLRGTGAF